MKPLIECVPNFSEGRNTAHVDALEEAIASVAGSLVLNRTSDPDHNRSVITFVGDEEAVVESAVRAASKAAELIDLNRHRGVHPRLGALDVLPFVPLSGATLADCAATARVAGERIWKELRIPVYFYEAAAARLDRVKLEDVRRGQFEGLREAVVSDRQRRPDVGGPGLHPTAGAVIAGARKILIAYNINLKTTDLEVAQMIAKRIRASSGGFPAVKALGLPLLTRNLVQVSMNITDFEQTPLHIVYSEVSRLAAAQRVEIEESELVGLVPRQALETAAAGLLKLANFESQSVLENRIDALSGQPKIARENLLG
ncbi:MAG: glutamate formimidoyltransferase [Acidobacteriaceae bacterium]|nr:glutamate formimidoyltransferase [Acidobacteriaceae bacterium]